MCRDRVQAVNPPLHEFIHECATCGSQAERAYAILLMCIFSESVAQLACRLGIDCDADRVCDAPLEIAIEIDEALNGRTDAFQDRGSSEV